MGDRNKSSWFTSAFRCMDFSDVVEIMATIIQDDGPLPMRNGKPIERIKNAADKFKEFNQSEYEGFSKTRDGVERVHNHNTAYPKLRDELDRRRSLTKVAIPYLPNKRGGPHNMLDTDSKFNEIKPKLSKTKRKYERRPNMKIEKAKTKLIKPKRKYKKCIVRNLQCVCQLTKSRCKKGTEGSRRPKRVAKKKHQHLEMDVEISSPKFGSTGPDIYLKDKQKSDCTEDFGYRDPDTSYASISSYVSFASTNHEPEI